MESVRVGNSTVTFCIETSGSCETEIGQEILRDTQIKCLCLVKSIELGEGDNAVAVTKEYCERYKDYPIIFIASCGGQDSREAMITKMRNRMVYDNLGFHDLLDCYDDGDTEYYIANNKASIPVYEVLRVKAFLIQFEEIMADNRQTDRLIAMMTKTVYGEGMSENIYRWVSLWNFGDAESLKELDAFANAK